MSSFQRSRFLSSGTRLFSLKQWNYGMELLNCCTQWDLTLILTLSSSPSILLLQHPAHNVSPYYNYFQISILNPLNRTPIFFTTSNAHSTDGKTPPLRVSHLSTLLANFHLGFSFNYSLHKFTCISSRRKILFTFSKTLKKTLNKKNSL